jgi:hypothetical protein
MAYARSPRRHLAPTVGQIKALVGVHPDGIFFICLGARHQHRLRALQVFFIFPGRRQLARAGIRLSQIYIGISGPALDLSWPAYFMSWLAYFMSWPAYFMSWPAYSMSWPAYFMSWPAYSMSWPAYFMSWPAYFMSWPSYFMSRPAYFMFSVPGTVPPSPRASAGKYL